MLNEPNSISDNGIATLDVDEIEEVSGGKSATNYFGGAGAFALGAGSVIRGGLIVAGVATAPGWVGAAMVVAGAAGAAYGAYQMYEALSE